MRLAPFLFADRRGVSVVEFALLAPLLMALLVGLLGYGQYFLAAHTAQQLANDAARATVAGIDAAERLTLARASVARELAALPELKQATVTTTVEEAPQLVTVKVSLDAAALPLLRSTLVPMPSTTIERRAVMRPGGQL
jgi:Flp pilus assembly protein TadG